MKEIKRNNYPSIIKKEIDLENIINYEDIDLELITNLINDVISNYTYNTFDLLKLLKDNFNDNLVNTITGIKDFSDVRFNCCYATTLLKNKLNDEGINSKIISYKSTGFSSPYGDSLIKEAHMSLLIPTKRNNRIFYLILDPGLRIPIPIGFYSEDDQTLIKIDNDEIIIKKTNHKDYQYCMKITGYNRYSANNTSCSCKEFFDINYETLNPLEVLFPISYEILEGYRIINYSTCKNNRASIKLMIIDKYLECRDDNNNIKINFYELNNKSKDDLIILLQPFTKKLNVDTEELIKIILFTIDHVYEFINSVINKNVFKEKMIINKNTLLNI